MVPFHRHPRSRRGPHAGKIVCPSLGEGPHAAAAAPRVQLYRMYCKQYKYVLLRLQPLDHETMDPLPVGPLDEAADLLQQALGLELDLWTGIGMARQSRGWSGVAWMSM